MRVVVALIVNDNNELLITQRSPNIDHGGLWEFPGGKREAGETDFTALCREIREEVGLTIHAANQFTEITFDYGDKKVNLLFFLVQDYLGKAECLESQTALRWVKVEDLDHYTFPAANFKIIPLLKDFFSMGQLLSQ